MNVVIKKSLKMVTIFVWTLDTPGIKTLSSWCIVHALIAFPINGRERLLFKYFCPPGILLDAIWFHSLDTPVLDLLAVTCSLDLIYFSTGNWFARLLQMKHWQVFSYWEVKIKRWFQSGRGITVIKAATEIILTSAINLSILCADYRGRFHQLGQCHSFSV